jgi:protein tyrosine phosphatase (PTP) superfamily phosphohydrolase (DUF442 family)
MNTIKNYVRVTDTIATSGQPRREDFRGIAEEGYSAIVNLASGTSPDAIPDEGEVAAGEGMAYYHIPVVWTAPEISDLERFFSLMDTLRGEKVWVHCAMNKRVTAFMYLYLLIRRGLPEGEARAPMDKVWEPDDMWREFINRAKDFYLPVL